MRLDFNSPITVEAADGQRLIEGVAATYGVVANASTGPVMLLEGALPLDGPAPKMIRDHDRTAPIGLVTARTQVGNDIRFTARISDTAAGTEALTLAADGVLDSVSVGIEATDYTYMTGAEVGTNHPRVLVVAAAKWPELSLLPFGAFASAKIDRVAAEEADPDEPEDNPTDPASEEETPMTDQPAAEATIQSPALTFAPKASARPVTAGQYASAVITGQPVPVLAADEVVADIPGLIPDLLVGSIWDSFNDRRPIITALGSLAMPAGGESFYRRKVSQHVAIGVQTAEFDTLASQQYQVDRIQVDKKWYGGYLNVSEQAQAYSDPNLLDLIIRDMSRVYAAQTEQYTATFLIDNSGTATNQVADFTDGDDVIAGLYDGAAEIYAATGMMPTALVVSSGVWAKMGQALDAGNNRIFPYLGPNNAAGTFNGASTFSGNPLGLRLIVTDGILAATGGALTEAAILMFGEAMEVYEDRRGALRVEQPSTLSTQLAFRGVIACADIELAAGSLIIGSAP